MNLLSLSCGSLSWAQKITLCSYNWIEHIGLKRFYLATHEIAELMAASGTAGKKTKPSSSVSTGANRAASPVYSCIVADWLGCLRWHKLHLKLFIQFRNLLVFPLLWNLWSLIRHEPLLQLSLPGDCDRVSFCYQAIYFHKTCRDVIMLQPNLFEISQWVQKLLEMARQETDGDTMATQASFP